LFEPTISAQNISGLATVATTGNIFDLINVSKDPNLPIQAGHTLVWNGTTFVNAVPTGGGGGGGSSQFLNDLLDVTISLPQSGKVLRYNGTNWVDAQLSFTDIAGAPTNTSYTFVGLGDTNDIAINNGFLRWNATHSQIIYQATIAATDITGLAPVATSGVYNDLTGKPLVPTTLNTLTDVATTLPTNGDALIWNSVAAKWGPSAVSAGGATNLDGLSDVSIATPTTGNTLRYNGSSWVNDVLQYTDLSGGPTLAAVATSGSYNDLIETPFIPTQLSTLSDVSIPSPVDGQHLIYNAATLKWTSGTSAVTRIQDSSNVTFVDVSTTPNTVSIKANVGGNVVIGSADGSVIINSDVTSETQITAELGLNIGVNSTQTPYVKIQGLQYPNADGSTGQALVTNGSGVLSWASAASATSFLVLTDTPSSYVGSEGKIVAVNALGSGLEFVSATANVASVFGRTGVVVAEAGDYTSTQITNSSLITAGTVTDALNQLNSAKLGFTAPFVAGNLAMFSEATAGVEDSGFTSASFATAAQGAKADTALQTVDLSTHSINEFSDVDIATVAPVDGQVLVWSDDKFIPGDAAPVATPATTEWVKITYNLDGTVTDVPTNIGINHSSGILVQDFTSFISTDIVLQVSFPGATCAPASIVLYGYIYDNNTYNFSVPLAATGNYILPGGISGSPLDITSAFDSMDLTVKVDKGESGAVNGGTAPGFATHTYVMFKF
jgi:hypothetical protein